MSITPEPLESSMRAYIFVNVQAGKVKQVVKAFAKIPQVKMVDACWGRPDIIAHVEVGDQKDLETLVLSMMQKLPAVVSTDTHIVIMD
jgi:DNA-binding Lrp family transcriptional regulator